MKRPATIFLAAFLISVLPVLGQQNEPETIVQQAAYAYAIGDYESAIALYEQLIATMPNIPSLYANLGIAYYGEGDLGLALVNLLRARQLSPRMQAISTLIAQIRSERVDFQIGEASYLDIVAESVGNVITVNEFSWVVFAGWSMWGGALMMVILWAGLRRSLRGLLVIMGGIVLLSVGVLVTSMYVSEERPRAVVVADVVMVMSGPGESYLPLYRLFSAAEMRVLSEEGEWARVVLPDGRQGWIEQSMIALV